MKEEEKGKKLKFKVERSGSEFGENRTNELRKKGGRLRSPARSI